MNFIIIIYYLNQSTFFLRLNKMFHVFFVIQRDQQAPFGNVGEGEDGTSTLKPLYHLLIHWRLNDGKEDTNWCLLLGRLALSAAAPPKLNLGPYSQLGLRFNLDLDCKIFPKKTIRKLL